MLIQFARVFTAFGVLSAILNIGMVVLLWLYRRFSNDTFYIGTAEYAYTGLSSLVCNGIAVFFYSIARAPSDTRGKRIALVSLLLTFALLFPPLLGVVGLILANFSKQKPPAKFGSCHKYQFYVAYGLAILGFVMMISPYTPLLRQTLFRDENMEAMDALMAGTLCAGTALVLARSLGMARMRGAVILAWTDLSLWVLAPLFFGFIN